MNLTGYVMTLESLINRYTILVLIQAISFLSALVLIWIVPYIGKPIKSKYQKRKTKRKQQIEKLTKTRTIIGQVIVSILFIAGGIFVVGSDVATLNNLKKDFNLNSVAIYTGDAHLWNDYRRTGAILNFIVDSRNVSFDNTDDTYIIDMSKVNEGWFQDSGDFHGKITYGENSKFILKIE